MKKGLTNTFFPPPPPPPSIPLMSTPERVHTEADASSAKMLVYPGKTTFAVSDELRRQGLRVGCPVHLRAIWTSSTGACMTLNVDAKLESLGPATAKFTNGLIVSTNRDGTFKVEDPDLPGVLSEKNWQSVSLDAVSH